MEVVSGHPKDNDWTHSYLHLDLDLRNSFHKTTSLIHDDMEREI